MAKNLECLANAIRFLDSFFFFDTMGLFRGVSVRSLPISVYFIKIGGAEAETTQDDFFDRRM
ncbi:MAG: hypothetical protein ACI351_00690 [Candidatus Avelusimicrobium sp.]|uniref:hypothetical protein n=1 Tax=Candidatus Avelusimicrobium sp. TaxID=3048833 RepID=UPI003F0E3C73